LRGTKPIAAPLEIKSAGSVARASPVSHPHDPLYGITLENIVNQLVQRHGWSEMGGAFPSAVFQFNPSVKSSLTFLRKTRWARRKVEDWFIPELEQIMKRSQTKTAAILDHTTRAEL
jgi:uncharacterized protein (DUF2132 family)